MLIHPWDGAISETAWRDWLAEHDFGQLAPADFGVLSVLVCGDLFHDGVLSRLGALEPDMVLVPLARGFDADVADEAQWHDQEQAIYAGQMHRIGAAGLLANQLAARPARCFGGALAVAGRWHRAGCMAPARRGASAGRPAARTRLAATPAWKAAAMPHCGGCGPGIPDLACRLARPGGGS